MGIGDEAKIIRNILPRYSINQLVDSFKALSVHIAIKFVVLGCSFGCIFSALF